MQIEIIFEGDFKMMAKFKFELTNETTFFVFIDLIFFCSNLLLGQQYINLSVDNDLYFSLDRYYSSGIFISTGKLKTVTNQGVYPIKNMHIGL